MKYKNTFLAGSALSFLATLAALVASAFHPINALIPLALFVVNGGFFVHLHASEAIAARNTFQALEATLVNEIKEITGKVKEVETAAVKRIESIEQKLAFGKLTR